MTYAPPRPTPAGAVTLAERQRTPAEEILALLPESQRRVAEVDDAAAARILEAYERARQSVAADIMRRYEATIGSGREPTPGQLAAFARDETLLRTLDEREAEIRGQTVQSVLRGYNSAVTEAFEATVQERAAIGRQFPAVLATTFVPPPDFAEETGIMRAVEDAQRIARETRERAATTLTQAALEGRGINEMVRRLTPVFEGNARRAELTSRYTMIKAYNTARLAQYVDIAQTLRVYNRRLYKMWLTSIDDRTCPICLALHGTLVDLDENFDLEATYSTTRPPRPWPDARRLQEPPRHARCRCSLVPWVEGWTTENRRVPEHLREQARRRALSLGYLARSVRGFRRGAATAATVVGAGGAVFLVARGVRLLRNGTFRGAIASYLNCAKGVPIVKKRGPGFRFPVPVYPGPRPTTAPPERRPPSGPGAPSREPSRPRREPSRPHEIVPPPIPGRPVSKPEPSDAQLPTDPIRRFEEPPPDPPAAFNRRERAPDPWGVRPAPRYLPVDNGELPLRDPDDPQRLENRDLYRDEDLELEADFPMRQGMSTKFAMRDAEGNRILAKEVFGTAVEDMAYKLGRTLGLMHPESTVMRITDQLGSEFRVVAQELYPLEPRYSPPGPDKLDQLLRDIVSGSHPSETFDDMLRGAVFSTWIGEEDANTGNWILTASIGGARSRFITIDHAWSLGTRMHELRILEQFNRYVPSWFRYVRRQVDAQIRFDPGDWMRSVAGVDTPGDRAVLNLHAADELIQRIESITKEQLRTWMLHEYPDLSLEKLNEIVGILGSRRDELRRGWDLYLTDWSERLALYKVSAPFHGIGNDPRRGAFIRRGRRRTEAFPGYELVRAPLTARRVRSDLNVIEDVLTEDLGMGSAWEGRVGILRDGGVANGAKDYTCRIDIEQSEAANPVTRWSTLIHESLHAVSFGHYLSPLKRARAYRDFMPWEEAVVEKVARLKRGGVLAEARRRGVRNLPTEAELAALDADSVYNSMIDVLEEIRTGLSMGEEEFYVGLLRVPMHKREALVEQWLTERSRRLRAPERAQVANTLSFMRQGRLRVRDRLRSESEGYSRPRPRNIRRPHPTYPHTPRPSREEELAAFAAIEEVVKDNARTADIERGRPPGTTRVLGVLDSTEDHLNRLLKPRSGFGTAVATRVRNIDTMLRILEDGKFKPMTEGVESSTSGGFYFLPERLAIEERMFQYDPEMPTGRPIYGYIEDLSEIDEIKGNPVLTRGTLALTGYGSVRVIFRPEIRERTTFTTTDTFPNVLSTSINDPLYIVPSPVDEPDVFSNLFIHELLEQYEPNRPRDIRDIPSISVLNRESYMEAQIHGGVTTEDIAEVLIPMPSGFFTGNLLPDQRDYAVKVTRLTEELRRRGIEFSFYAPAHMP